MWLDLPRVRRQRACDMLRAICGAQTDEPLDVEWTDADVLLESQVGPMDMAAMMLRMTAKARARAQEILDAGEAG